MKSRAERLDEMLKSAMCIDHNPEEQELSDLKDAKEAIIALFMECVPEFITQQDYYDNEYAVTGFNECREETLKNIEEMGK